MHGGPLRDMSETTEQSDPAGFIVPGTNQIAVNTKDDHWLMLTHEQAEKLAANIITILREVRGH